MQITFINHAAVRVVTKGVGVLSDPWLEGSAFNNGWDLLIETPLALDAVMEGVTHVWVSHEHPDHFAPRFFVTLAKQHPNTIILMQKTRDQRMKRFCEGKGFRVIELESGQPVKLSAEVTARCDAFDFYDSWLHLSDGEHSVLNLNDCAIDDERTLQRLRTELGAPDVLFTQYSYAAWKGGRENDAFRRFAAQRKLDTITTQIRLLQPRHVLPFASMVFFSNVENDYMNDAVNDVDTTCAAIRAAGATPLPLYPGESWVVGAPHDEEASRARYRAAYQRLPELPRRPTGESVPIAALQSRFESYKEKIFAENSKRLIHALRRVPKVGAFKPVRVLLTDLNQVVSVSVVDGFEVVDGPADVQMHSSSLDFIFANSFGYDTLTVNGRFEATPEGFSRMTKSLAIGSLNGMGLSVSRKLLKDAWVVGLLLQKLRRVRARL